MEERDPASSPAASTAGDPELVGRHITGAGGLALGPATGVLRRRVLDGVADRVRVETGELGEDAGAATLVLREILAGSQEA